VGRDPPPYPFLKCRGHILTAMPVNIRVADQSGIALVLVLWVVTLLALVAASSLGSTRTQLELARNTVENAKAEALADAGVYRAMLALLEPDFGQGWRADGTPYDFILADGRIEVSVQDEAGKIGLNVASEEQLRGLFQAIGLDAPSSAALAGAIADWRDRDDLRRPDGAEAEDYRKAGLPYGPGNRPFAEIGELRQVLGMTTALYERLAPLLTVYSRRQEVDVMTAPREVLLSLFGSSTGEEVLAARQAGPNTAGADIKVGIYGIRTEANTKSGAVFVREAVVGVMGAPSQPFQIYDWRRGKTADAGSERESTSATTSRKARPPG
jgi:general secretion pathway protein K